MLAADLGLRGSERMAAGLVPASFDHVLANPPFDPGHAGRSSPDPRRALAHRMKADTLEAWCRTASATLVPGGSLTMIVRPEGLTELLAAWVPRFSGPTLRPVHAVSDRRAIRLLAYGRKGRRDPLALLPPLILRSGDGPSPLAEAIAAGDSAIEL